MCRLFLMTIAFLAVLFGISGLYMMPKLLQRKIEEIGTKNYDRFTRIPIPLRVKFYFFNVSNSEQVLRGLERPRFEEVGPFVYEQWRRRSVVDITDNNRKITYKEYKTYYPLWPQAAHEPQVLERELTINGANSIVALNPYSHNVTIVNLPLLSVLTKLASLEENSLKRNIAAKIVARLIREGNEHILITRPVNELLFDGYKVGVMEAARELVSTTLGFNFESPLPRNKFGFFHGKNGTWKRDEGGELTIFTGRNESMNDFMLVDNWNGLRQLNTWPRNTVAGQRCNEIRGTDGSQFHPGVTRDQVLHIFSPMICSSLHVKYREDTECRDIPLLRFTTTPAMFAAPKKLARTNACYCTIKDQDELQEQNSWSLPPQPLSTATTTTSTNQHLDSRSNGSTIRGGHSNINNNNNNNNKARITNGRCYIDGLLDLSLCQKGAPVAASPPHFYNGDPLLALAAGLRPNKTLHETYMDVEPMTGAVMRAASRAQLNAYVEQAALEVVDSALIGHMAPMVAPLLWFEEAAEIDPKTAREFKGQLLDVVSKARRSFALAIAFGLLLALLVTLQYWYVTCYKLRNSHIKSRSSSDKNKSGSLNSKAKRSSGRPPAGQAKRRARNATGARKSNLAQMDLRPLQTGDEGVAKEVPSSRDMRQAAVGAAVAVASVLGAADAAATRNQRRQRRSKQEAEPNGSADEDELSRRGLVAYEWPLADQLRQASSSTGGDESQCEPGTSRVALLLAETDDFDSDD